MKKLNLIKSLLILILIFMIFINVNSYLFHFDEYIRFLEIYINRDGNISNPSFAFIRIVLYLIFILLISLFVIFNPSNLIKKRFSLIRNYQNLNKIEKIFFIFIFILFIPSILQLVNNYTFNIKYETSLFFKITYNEDGFLEYLTTLFALLASFILILSLNIQKGKLEIFVKIILSFLFFLFAMEEISWGQRILGWETPQSFNDINHQNETNLHNIFNPYFHIFYPIFNFTMAIFIFFSINYKKKIINYFKSEKYIYLLPSQNYVFFIFIYLILSVHCQFYTNELTEEIFSIHILMYSMNQLNILRNNNK